MSEVYLRDKKDRSSQYIEWHLSVESDGEHDGWSLRHVSSLSDEWRHLAERDLLAVGLTGEFILSEDSNERIIEPELEGRRARAVVVLDEFMGEKRNKVRTLLPA